MCVKHGSSVLDDDNLQHDFRGEYADEDAIVPDTLK